MERRYDYLYKSLYVVGAAVVCFLLLLPNLRLIPLDAQTTSLADPTSERELDQRIQSFFVALIRDNPSQGIDELLRRSVFSSSGVDSSSVDQLRNNIDKAKTEFGEIIYYEKYGAKRVGEDVFVIRYILKYDRHPVMWKFTFYRKPSNASSLVLSTSAVPNPWLLTEIRFGSDMDSP